MRPYVNSPLKKSWTKFGGKRTIKNDKAENDSFQIPSRGGKSGDLKKEKAATWKVEHGGYRRKDVRSNSGTLIKKKNNKKSGWTRRLGGGQK